MKKLHLFGLLLAFIASGLTAQNIVITEISYNPPESGSDSTEYIELYNNGSTTVDLAGYSFTSGVVHTFSTYMLAPGAYLVVAVDSVAINNVYGVSAIQWSSGGLSNGGEPIALKDNLGNLVDSLRYDDNSPWPDGTAPGAPADPDGSGPSIRLCDPNADNTDGANWSTSDEMVTYPLVNGKQVYGSPGSAGVCSGASTLAVTATVDNNVSCFGQADGSATGMATGGATPYTYSWSNGATTATATGLAASTYTIVVTDNNGTSASAQASISQPTVLNATITSTQDVLCNGESTGSITAGAGGGTAPYSYLWSNGDTTNMITSLAAGSYSLTVTDANGCTSFNTGSVTEPTALNPMINKVDVTTNGGSDGSATSTATGGTSPYTYLWSSGGTTSSITGLTAGTYTLTLTDANGCDSIQAVVINQPTSISVNVSTTNTFCNGSADGTAMANASGGTAPYTYAWSNAGTTQTITNLLAGSYFVTVTDNSGSTSTGSGTVTEPAALVAITVVDSNVTVNGGSDGGASASASGGTVPYTYLWSNGATNASITGVMAGTYTVTVADNNACTNSSSVTITEPAAISLSATVTDITCNGANDGMIDLSVMNGTTPYAYLWSNGDTIEDIMGLGAGTYTVTVTDAVNATASQSYTVTEPTAINIVVSVDSNASCNGLADGGLSATATGGTGVLQYAWSAGNKTLAAQSFESMTSDNWAFTVNPATYNTEGDSIVNGSDDVWAVIEEFTGDIDTASNGLYFWGVQDIDNTNGGGSFYHTMTFSPINVSMETGVKLAFDYYSDGFDSSDSIEYQVEFNNDTTWATNGIPLNKNTQAWTTLEVDVPDTANFVRLRLQAKQNGSSDYAGFDHVQLYTSSSSVTGLSAGTYTVTVTDALGCTAVSNGVITEPAPLTATKVVTNASTVGASDGAIDLTVMGGTPAYTYSWSNGVTTEDNLNIVAGSYTVTITDANGCSLVDSATVQDPANIILGHVATDVTCNGNFDGSITVTPTGGTMPYSYLWAPTPITGQGTNTVTGLGAGQYNVTVTDAVGTTASALYTVTEPVAIITSLSITNASAQGVNDGAIAASVFGGVSPYTYSWSAGMTTPTITGLAAGNYCVTVTDANGCTDVECGDVLAPGALAQLVITEINYNGPESGTDTSEFIEFVNVGMNTVNLDGYTFNQGVTHTFTADDSITAGQYFVIAYDSSAFRNRYGMDANAVWTSGGLGNSGEDIVIADNFGRSIDSVDYDDSAPWPAGTSAGGPDGGGASIELIDSTSNNNDGVNWLASATPITGVIVNGLQIYGTPGMGSISVGVSEEQLAQNAISIYPNPVKAMVTIESKTMLKNTRVQILAMDGKILRDELFNQTKLTLDMSEFADGVYFVRIGDTVRKLILSK